MLLGQDCGGYQHGDLFAVHDGLEGGAEGHLGLAIAHIATDEAIHGTWELHVGLDFVKGAGLGFGLNVGEGRLQLGLPQGVDAEGMTCYYFARSIQGQ